MYVVRKLGKIDLEEWFKIRIVFIKLTSIFIIFGKPRVELEINITLPPIIVMTFDLPKKSGHMRYNSLNHLSLSTKLFLFLILA